MAEFRCFELNIETADTILTWFWLRGGRANPSPEVYAAMQDLRAARDNVHPPDVMHNDGDGGGDA